MTDRPGEAIWDWVGATAPLPAKVTVLHVGPGAAERAALQLTLDERRELARLPHEELGRAES